MKAGSFGNHRDADPERLWAAMPTDAHGEANGTRRSPKIDRAHAGDLGAGGNAGPICFSMAHERSKFSQQIREIIPERRLLVCDQALFYNCLDLTNVKPP